MWEPQIRRRGSVISLSARICLCFLLFTLLLTPFDACPSSQVTILMCLWCVLVWVCSENYETKRQLFLGRKIMTNLDSILKSRDITFLTKVHIVKAMVLPIVMHGCESWTIKKAECQIIDAFVMLKNWCFCVVGEYSSRVPWTARRSNQSNLREINPECSLKGLMLKLKLQYFGHWMRRTDLLEKTLRKDWRWEEKGTTENEMVEWHHWLSGHGFEQALRVGEGQGSLPCYSSWGRKESDTTKWLNWKLYWLI